MARGTVIKSGDARVKNRLKGDSQQMIIFTEQTDRISQNVLTNLSCHELLSLLILSDTLLLIESLGVHLLSSLFFDLLNSLFVSLPVLLKSLQTFERGE